MDTLVETILERDKKRGRWRNLCITSRTSDAVAAQKRPAPKGKPEFGASAALRLLDVSHNDTPSLSCLASVPNWGFHCIHYLVNGQYGKEKEQETYTRLG